MDAFLDVCDTYEERQSKLHIMDIKDHPERHDFSESSYTMYDIQNKCMRCWESEKGKFVNDIAGLRVIKKC